MCQGGKPDTDGFHSSYIGMNECDSTYENECVHGRCYGSRLSFLFLYVWWYLYVVVSDIESPGIALSPYVGVP